MSKGVIVGTVLLICVIGRRMHRQRLARLQRDQSATPRIPETITAGSTQTWILFTTKYCAQCGPIEALLRQTQPDARVVTIDAEHEPLLARAQRVKSAPTVLLANGAGVVEQRLVGADAVTKYLRAFT